MSRSFVSVALAAYRGHTCGVRYAEAVWAMNHSPRDILCSVLRGAGPCRRLIRSLAESGRTEKNLYNDPAPKDTIETETPKPDA